MADLKSDGTTNDVTDSDNGGGAQQRLSRHSRLRRVMKIRPKLRRRRTDPAIERLISRTDDDGCVTDETDDFNDTLSEDIVLSDDDVSSGDSGGRRVTGASEEGHVDTQTGGDTSPSPSPSPAAAAAAAGDVSLLAAEPRPSSAEPDGPTPSRTVTETYASIAWSLAVNVWWLLGAGFHAVYRYFSRLGQSRDSAAPADDEERDADDAEDNLTVSRLRMTTDVYKDDKYVATISVLQELLNCIYMGA